MFPVPSEPIVTFGCPECGGKLTVPAELLGVSGPCPLCHGEITAPQWSAPEIPLGASARRIDRERIPTARRARSPVVTASNRQRTRIRPLNQRRESRLPAASVHPRGCEEPQTLELEGTEGAPWQLPAGCDIRRIGFPPPITGKASSRREREIASPENSTNFRSTDHLEPRIRRRSSPQETGGSGLSRALLFGFALTVVAAGIPLAGVHYYRSSQGSAEPAPMQEAVVESEANDRREVLMRLRAFHEAESAEAKAAFVLDGSEEIEAMRPYYEEHAPEPTGYTVDPTLEFFERDGTPAVRGRGRYGSRDPFVFEFSKRGDEWLLDWSRFKAADRLADNGALR